MSPPTQGRLGSLALALSPLVALLPVDSGAAPAPAHRDVRTYRFTARVTDNGGVTPFKLGSLITGTFGYDLKGKHKRPDAPRYGVYMSAKNALTFEGAGLRFAGAGEVLAIAFSSRGVEHFGIVAPDLKLPKGWRIDHGGRSQTYSILLQNVPPRKAITGHALPDRLSLPDFVSSRELRLDFFHGVRFPGGRVNGRATVYARLESFKELGR
jgi:hypothetical protein